MQYVANEIVRDEYGRPNGILIIDKPAGITSHDVVYAVRKALGTTKVGHAGALDPFATGVLIILVGKATKLSDTYLNQKKAYTAKVVFGVQTDSADPEGEIISVNTDLTSLQKSLENINNVLQSFVPSYQQYVPVFSSVKVDGEKLRVLARRAESWEISDGGTTGKQFIYNLNGKQHSVDIPQHICEIPYIKLLAEGQYEITNDEFTQKLRTFDIAFTELPSSALPCIDIEVECSKGTYIRTLAEDIGARLEPSQPSMLWELRRIRVGDFDIQNSLQIADLPKFALPAVE